MRQLRITSSHRRRGASALLGAVAASLLVGCGLGVDDATRMENARQYMADHEYRAAAIELKNVLRSDPENIQARFLLGTSAAAMGDMPTAEKELVRARELGISAGEVAVPLARALLFQNKFEQVINDIDPSVAGSDADRAELIALQGSAWLGSGQNQPASEAFAMALSIDERSETALLGQAELARRNGNAEAARQYVDRALANDGQSMRALSALGRMQLEASQFSLAEESFKQAETAADGKVTVQELFLILAGRTEAALGLAKLDEAGKLVNRMQGMAPGHPMGAFLAGRVAYDQEDFEGAVENLQKALSQAPDYLAAQLLLGASNIARGEFEQADMHLSAVLAAQPDNVRARKLLAQTRMRQNRPGEAMETLRPVLNSSGGDTELFGLMARASLRSGDQSSGLSWFAESIEADPENPDLRLDLAAGYIAAGDSEQALEVLSEIPEDDAGQAYRREMLEVMALLEKQDYEAGRQRVTALVEGDPDAWQVHNLAGGFYLAAADPDKARFHLGRALELRPDNVPALINLARLEVDAQKPDVADKLLADFEKANPGNLAALMTRSQLAEKTGDMERARSLLEQAMEANPGAPQPRLILGRYHLSRGDVASAEPLVERAVQDHPEIAVAQELGGQLRLAQGRHQEALRFFEAALKLNPNDANSYFHLARAQVALGDEDEARKSLEAVLERQPGHLRATTALVTLESRAGNTGRALSLVQLLKNDYPGSGAPFVLEGDVQLAANNPEVADAAYTRAWEIGASRALATKLFEARRRSGADGAIDPLSSWVTDNPDDFSGRMILAQSYQRVGEDSNAIEQYEVIVESQPQNAVALNNLAWLYAQDGSPGQRAKAIDAAEKAHAAMPDTGPISDTLGWLLVQDGQLDRGLELLQQAAAQAAGDRDIQYHLASALHQSGKSEQARRILAEILADTTEFGSRTDALALLEQL
ncbi:MAG: XrtA/PEP-CTERM system TPR-repeat protein PrsT [Pseudomonadota bacterium]